MSCHLSFSPLFIVNSQTGWLKFFSETAVLIGRASSGLHCTMNPCRPQQKTLGCVLPSCHFFHVAVSSLVSVFCVICQYWETVERLWCLHWLKGDLVLMTNFQDEPGSCFKTRRTLHNQRHTDTSKCTTWLPHERFDWTNTPHFQSFANIKPYAYLRVKRGRTFYWLNFCVCSLS